MAHLRIIGLATGQPTEHDGRYLVDYDHKEDCLITTDDPAKARQFQSAIEAIELWRAEYGLRLDGKPNRPLTAYSVEIG